MLHVTNCCMLFCSMPAHPSSSLQRLPGIDSRQSPSSVARICPFEYRYLTEFQSHEPEFDYLKSLEIEEKINKVQWCNPSGGSRMLLSTNDKTIKLWKVRSICTSSQRLIVKFVRVSIKMSYASHANDKAAMRRTLLQRL